MPNWNVQKRTKAQPESSPLSVTKSVKAANGFAKQCPRNSNAYNNANLKASRFSEALFIYDKPLFCGYFYLTSFLFP